MNDPLLIRRAAQVLLFVCLWLNRFDRTAAEAVQPQQVPIIHVTDLFRPHDDPDDHWDLACVYAQVAQGKVDLRGVQIDYPKAGRANDPDVMAVAQLNYLTGETVPVMVGASRWFDRAELAHAANDPDLRGIRAMLEIMRESRAPVVIHVLGSCRDVALAGRMEPELFAEKCRAVYLNAGSGTPDKTKARQLEWNVRLDPRGYATLFELPCPIYWMPCFQEVHPRPADLFQVAEYGTFYRFRQGDVLPHLSPGMQGYFAFMFQHGRFLPGYENEANHPNWLQSLTTSVRPELMDRLNAMDRNMWCTGGFLHAVGLTVTTSGEIVPMDEADDPVFTFTPVRVSCSADGLTEWSHCSAETNRFLFHVEDVERYPAAMTSALRSLLTDKKLRLDPAR